MRQWKKPLSGSRLKVPAGLARYPPPGRRGRGAALHRPGGSGAARPASQASAPPAEDPLPPLSAGPGRGLPPAAQRRTGDGRGAAFPAADAGVTLAKSFRARRRGRGCRGRERGRARGPPGAPPASPAAAPRPGAASTASPPPPCSRRPPPVTFTAAPTSAYRRRCPASLPAPVGPGAEAGRQSRRCHWLGWKAGRGAEQREGDGA